MDARVRYTKNMIRSVFLELLKEKPVSSITVKSICDQAMINRATFYKYYENSFDLLKKLEKGLLDNLQERIDREDSSDILNVFRIVLNDVIENREMYLVLFSKNGDTLFKERLFSLCYKENIKTIREFFPDLDEKKQEWIYYFMAEGCNGLLNRWIQNDMQDSPEEMIMFIGHLIKAVNNGNLS